MILSPIVDYIVTSFPEMSKDHTLNITVMMHILLAFTLCRLIILAVKPYVKEAFGQLVMFGAYLCSMLYSAYTIYTLGYSFAFTMESCSLVVGLVPLILLVGVGLLNIILLEDKIERIQTLRGEL